MFPDRSTTRQQTICQHLNLNQSQYQYYLIPFLQVPGLELTTGSKHIKFLSETSMSPILFHILSSGFPENHYHEPYEP